jgi:hypothetical protein
LRQLTCGWDDDGLETLAGNTVNGTAEIILVSVKAQAA